MAVVNVYFLNTAATTPNWFGKVQDGGSAPAGALSAFGWTVGKVAVTTPYWRGRLGATARANMATAGSYIDAATGPVQGTGNAATTAGDSFRSDNPLAGTFAAGNWNFTFGMRTGAATTVGRIRLHVWASANADGTSARKLNSTTLVGTTVTMSFTTTTYNSTVTWAAPQVVLNNEYLFTQIEWQETTAGTSNSCTAQFYQASFVTTDYVYDPATGTMGGTEGPDGASFGGLVGLLGTFAATETADDATITGGIIGTGTLAVGETPDDATMAGNVADPTAYEYIRLDGDVAADGWTNEFEETSNLYQSINETTASDDEYIQSPSVISGGLTVRLMEGSTEIASWTDAEPASTFGTVEQTLTGPQLAAIGNFSNLFLEFDDGNSNVYRGPLSNPAAGVGAPAILRYRYMKLTEGVETTTLDPAWKPSTVDLDETNLFMTMNTAGGNGCSRSITSYSTGKKFYRARMSIPHSSGGAVGLCVAAKFNLWPLGIYDSLSWGHRSSGAWWGNSGINFATSTGMGIGVDYTGTTASATTWTEVAIDFDAKLVWVRQNDGVNATLWNNISGSDPATGTSGVDWSTVAGTGPWYATVELPGTVGENQIEVDFTIEQAPSGFGAW